MLRALLALGLLCASLLAIAPSASAGITCTSPPFDRQTVGLACGGANTALDAAAWGQGAPTCLLNTAPVNWLATCGFTTAYPGQATGYVLCYLNTGILQWVGTCT
ncbi:MAG: hypothetical protein QOI63_528 [Thermoplasmata archaeon]|jgi:hypothetical protein|nr:hypothetical protein [Thermoplasmata archaeon]